MKTHSIAFVIILFTLVFCLSQCKKETLSNQNTGPLEIWDNVRVIDTAVLVIDFTNSDFANGTYVYTLNGIMPTIATGDIIVGSTGEGYIRKVASVTTNDNRITIQTSQATMEEVFKNGNFKLNADLSDMLPGKTSGWSYSETNKPLFSAGALSATLLSADVNFDPNWLLDFNFTPEDGITYFELSTKDAPYTAKAKVKFTSAGNVSLIERKDTLRTYSKIKIFMVGYVPVVVKYIVYLIAESEANISTSISLTADCKSTGNADVGAKYENNAWSGIYGFTHTDSVIMEPLSGGVTATATFGLRPVLSVKIYGVAGPRASIAGINELSGTLASPSLDWDFKADAWLQATAGADVTILGKTIANYPDQEWETDKVTYYRAPDTIQKISGDNQNASAGQNLPDPVKVKVTDSRGKAVRNVPVYFNVTAGNGSVNPTSILTDTGGYAQTTWTLGNGNTQTLSASAKYADLSAIANAPVNFYAVFDTTCNVNCPDTVTDNEGNVYNVVKIGCQCWIKENLKVNAGIPEVSDSVTWANNIATQTPGWCNYKNDAMNGISYGKLYNWYAISLGNICPNGWHVPATLEWVELINYLGGSTIAGGSMKSTIGWSQPNLGATNSSGFSALPGGARGYTGGWYSQNGYWWSSDLGSNLIFLSSGSAEATQVGIDNNVGASCRCIKD